MDETKLNDLLYEIRKLIGTLSDMGSTGGTRDTGPQKIATAFDRSSERLVRALAQLGASMKSESRGRAARDSEIDDFVAAVDRATDAAEAQNQATAERIRSEQEAAQAAQRRAAVDQEVAERSAWTQKQRDDYDRRMAEAAAKLRFTTAQDAARQELYDMGRERNFAQELAEAKLREFRATFTMEKALGATGNFLSQKLGTNLVKTHLALTVFSGTVGAVASTLGSLGKSVLSLAASTATGFNNFNQFNVIVDSVVGAMSKMGQSMPFVGTAMILIGEGAKFMLNQLQRVSDSFNALAQVGGLTRDGMDGVNRQFLQSGLTLEGYTKQVSQNSQALARLGGTVGQGAEQFSRLTGAIIDGDIGLQLRSIGFSSEQIADAAAGFLTQQARLGRAQRMTQDQLMAGTIRYTRELDQIAKLTGLQREELQKRMDAALSEQRFRAKMNELERTGRGDVAKQLNMFQAAVSESAPGLAQGLRDIIAAGGAVTTDAARQAFQLTGGEIVGIAQRALSGEDVGASLQALAQSAGRGVQNFESIAQFADVSPIIGDLAQASDFANKGLNNFAETLDRIRRDQQAGMEAPTELTRGVVKSQQEMEQFSRSINAFSIALMPKAAGIVESFATTLNDATRKVAETMGIELPMIGKAAGEMQQAAAAAAQPRGGRGARPINRQSREAESGGAAPPMSPAQRIQRARGQPAAPVTGGAAPGAQVPPPPQGQVPIEAPPQQPVAGLPPGKTLQDLFVFTQPSGTLQNFQGLDNELKRRLVEAAVNYNAATGQKMQINSARRSSGDQWRLWEESVAQGRRGRTASGHPIAYPGTSPHERGLAVDIQNYRDAAARQALANAGLYSRVRNDPAHYHMADGGIARGPGSGYPATLHGTEAVVPLPDGRSIPVSFDQEFQDQIRRMFRDNSAGTVNFAEIARRSTTSQRSLDSVIGNIVPELRNMVREIEDAPDTAGTPNPMADATFVDRMASRLAQELTRGIDNILRQQNGSSALQNSLLEQMVNLQNRTVTASERLLRVSQS